MFGYLFEMVSDFGIRSLLTVRLHTPLLVTTEILIYLVGLILFTFFFILKSIIGALKLTIIYSSLVKFLIDVVTNELLLYPSIPVEIVKSQKYSKNKTIFYNIIK